MAASYPSSLPVKDAAGANLSTNPHSTLHDDMYDEIVAIATELGTLPKGTAATVKARLDSIDTPMASYSPTLTNITIGNGTQSHWWKPISGKTILVQNRIVFGSTTSFSGWPLIAPPASLASSHPNSLLGSYVATDSSAGTNYGGTIASNGATQVGPVGIFAANGAFTFLSSTVPFTWTIGDTLSMVYTAEKA